MFFRRRRSRREDDAWLEATIAEYGWAVLYIPEGPDTDEPSFHYTVGLTAKEQPELIVYSLPYEVGHDALNAVAEQVRDGLTLRDNEPVPGLPAEAPEFRTFAATSLRDPLGLATSRYGDAVRVRQVIFRDRHGRWPWEQDADRPWLTPLLFDPPRHNHG